MMIHWNAAKNQFERKRYLLTDIRNCSFVRFRTSRCCTHFRIETLVSPLGIKNLLWRVIFYIGGVTCSISSPVNFAFTSGSHVWGIFSAILVAFSFRILVPLPISISFQMSKIQGAIYSSVNIMTYWRKIIFYFLEQTVSPSKLHLSLCYNI